MSDPKHMVPHFTVSKNISKEQKQAVTIRSILIINSHLKHNIYYFKACSHTLRTTNGGRGSGMKHSQSQSEFCRRKPYSKLTGLARLAHGFRVGGALVVRLDGRLEQLCIISDMLGEPHGSGSQQKSSWKSWSWKSQSSLSVSGELQGTSLHALHCLTALQLVTTCIWQITITTTTTTIITTRKMCSHIDMKTHTKPAMDYISIDFGVDSSSSFPFIAWTDKQTDKLTV